MTVPEKRETLSDSGVFRHTVRRGIKSRSGCVIVYVTKASADVIARPRGPRIGLIISKAVGNSVVRHRTARRLRHVLDDMLKDEEFMKNIDFHGRHDCVVRVLPTVVETSAERLRNDVRHAFRKYSRKAG